MLRFDPYSPQMDADPFPTYRALRNEAPCFYSEDAGMWVLDPRRDHAAAPTSNPPRPFSRKLPLATRMSAPAIGELGNPIESSASISTLSLPLASIAQASATSSVMRRP